MIQDIFPSKLNNHYAPYELRESDRILIFNSEGKMLTTDGGREPGFLSGSEVPFENEIFLFDVDGCRYFLATSLDDDIVAGHSFKNMREIREVFEGKGAFIAFTAYHLWRWYEDNLFCGRCGGTNEHSVKERALVCTKCGHTVYPRINPAVIVGVTNGDKLLITRYRSGYAHNALVAGFTEIGETLEQTVEREVMEEAGVSVKNIRYYKSQPWGTAQDILVGFFCDVDGSDVIKMDEGELKYAEWTQRDEIELQPNNLSLTNEMMRVFKEGKI